jgi:hypothetical protein
LSICIVNKILGGDGAGAGDGDGDGDGDDASRWINNDDVVEHTLKESE